MPEHDNIFLSLRIYAWFRCTLSVDIQVFIAVGINVHNSQTDNNLLLQ